MPKKTKKEKKETQGGSSVNSLGDNLITTRVLVDTLIKVKKGSTKAELADAITEMRRVGELVQESLDEAIKATKGKYDLNITEPITTFSVTAGKSVNEEGKEEKLVLLALPEQNLTIPFTLELAMQLSHVWPEAIRSILRGRTAGNRPQGILVFGITGQPDDINN